MRLEIEYHDNDRRWYWRVYDDDRMGFLAQAVREGFARSLAEATSAGEIAAGEYRSRKVVQLSF